MWMVMAGWSWGSLCTEASRTRSSSRCSRRRRWRRWPRRSPQTCVWCWWRMRTRNCNHRSDKEICEKCFKTCLPLSVLLTMIDIFPGWWLITACPGALITNYQSYRHFIISEPHTPDCPSDRLGVIECDNPNSQSTNITQWQLTHGAS